MNIDKKELKEFIGNSIFFVAILLMIYFIIEHTYKDESKKSYTKENSTLVKPENEKEWVKQDFPEFQFSIKCPAILKNVSTKSNDDFDFNYAGGTGDDFYQVMIIRVPAGRKDMTKEQYKEFLKETFGKQGGGKHVLWGEEELPAYLLDDYTQEGFKGRGIAVASKGLIYAFNIMAKENLDFIFNRFTNNVKFLNQPTDIREEEPNSTNMLKMNTYTKSGFGAFFIDYPQGWRVNENPNQSICVSFTSPIEGKISKISFNIIVAHDEYSLEERFIDAQALSKEHIPYYTLLSKEDIIIKGMDGLKTDAKCFIQNTSIRVIGYQFKKKDNITYTISFTVESEAYKKYQPVIEHIIQSFNLI